MKAGEDLASVDAEGESGETPNIEQLVGAVAEFASASSGCDDVKEKRDRSRGKKSEIRLRAIEKHREQSVKSVLIIAKSLERRKQLKEKRSTFLALRKDDCETGKGFGGSLGLPLTHSKRPPERVTSKSSCSNS